MGNTIDNTPSDTSWIRASFLRLTPRTQTDYNRFLRGGGYLKYTDTTLGGNWAINAPYQFTRYADIKERRLMQNVGRGMGRYYSQHIDDYGHNVHIRCGIASYNSLLTYLTASVDGYAARYVATGRQPGFFDALGRISGWVVTVMFWEVSALGLIFELLSKLTSSRYYYLKPTMFQYWKTVQTILNSISANLNLSVSAVNSGDKAQGPGINEADLRNSGWNMDDPHYRLPTFFKSPAADMGAGGGTPDIGIDIHAVASRAQSLQVQYNEKIEEFLKQQKLGITAKELANNLDKYINSNMREIFERSINGGLRPKMENATMDAYNKRFTRLEPYNQEVSENTKGLDIQEAANLAASGEEKNFFQKTVDSISSWVNSDVKSAMTAEYRDGSAWFSLRVDNAADPVSESFNNSTETSDVAGLFNSFSSKIRSAAFNLGGGKTGIDIVDDTVGAAINGIGDFVAGAVKDNVFLNPVLGLLHGVQIDNPKRWASSSANLSTMSYSLKLHAGYGNRLSIFQDLYVPLAMVLAMVLPRGTGKQSYAAPFYVEFYSKGRAQTRIGLVTSVSIERGTGNMGWTKEGLPLGIDIKFTIEDMTDIMFAPPMSTISVLDKLTNPIEENAMGDYIACLSALGFHEQTYLTQEAKRGWNFLVNEFHSWTSPYRWAALGRDNTVGNIISMFNAQTARR